MMVRAAALLALVAALAACSGPPRPQANVHVTPSGVRVNPSVSGSLAGIGIRVSP
ncbi:hypothetical protein V8J36_17520 [Frigidibacter sp. MR17.14]|uniref:hypothetical protein n=1 Tax=Frigidibacter sp. MR17.14 TaxID=3126509 RepID=UPI003012C786